MSTITSILREWRDLSKFAADPRDELTDNIVLLRQVLERDTGLPIHHLYLNASVLLDDFCRAIGLTDAQVQRILGNGYDPVCDDETEPMIPIASASQIFEAS